MSSSKTWIIGYFFGKTAYLKDAVIEARNHTDKDSFHAGFQEGRRFRRLEQERDNLVK